MRKGILAMEGLEDIVEREVQREDAQRVDDDTAFVDAPEGDLVEAEAVVGELDVLDDQIDEAAQTADDLEVMGDAMRETLDEGGLAPREARSLELAVERMCTRIGIDPSEAKLFPAMEHFDNRATRIRNTRIALENIVQKGKEVWAHIVAIFQKAIEWMVKFYKHITDGAQRLGQRAEKLGEVAHAMAGKEPNAGSKLSLEGFGKVLQSKGKLAEGTTFVSELKKSLAQAQALSAAQIAMAKLGQNEMVSVIANAGAEGTADSVRRIYAAMAKQSPGRLSTNRDLGGKGYEVREESLVFGDQSFYSVFPVGETQDAGHGMSWTVSASAGAREVLQLTPVTPLSANEAGFVAATVQQHLKHYDGFTEQLKAIKQAANAAVKASQQEQGDQNLGPTGIQKLVRSYVGCMTSGASKLRSYDLSVCKAALDYASASLKALRGEDHIQVY